MVTKQTSFKKGSIGQRCVEKMFAGDSVFYWTDEETSHPFDGIALEWETYDIIAVEIKAKAARTWYPDTGFDVAQLERLRRAREKYSKDPLCIFVDEAIGKVYGNFLSILERSRVLKIRGVEAEYPVVENGIVYFPLVAMRELGDILKDELTELRELSTRNTAYEYPDLRHYEELGQDAEFA